MDDVVLDKMIKISEEFFGSEQHPDYIPITRESCKKFQHIYPNWLFYKLRDGEPVSWVVVLPTQTALMKQFIKGGITERQLLDLTKPEEKFEALYLCSAFTIPELRKQGYIIDIAKEAVDTIPLTETFFLFAWPVTGEGKQLAKKLESVLGHEILIKKP